MSLTIAVQMDAIDSINIKSDTTFLLLKEAQRRKYNILYYTTPCLSLIDGKPSAYVQRLTLNNSSTNFYTLEEPVKTDFSSVDTILMRQDPPFDLNYITYTHILDKLDPKILVVNNAHAVRNLPEKIFACKYPQLMPPTLITMDNKEILDFLGKYKQIIIKPLYAFGGQDIIKIDLNMDVETILANFFAKYSYPAMIQKFLPNIKNGDKRIILINGKAVGAINRIPQESTYISNLIQGGLAQKTTLNEKDLYICATIKNDLINNNIMLAGIDVIDGYLTEINITSPTGIVAINKVDNVKLEEIFWDELEKKIKNNKQKSF